jgi:hypothetical protein
MDGRLVEAVADAWIVRAAEPSAMSLGLAADWRFAGRGLLLADDARCGAG